MGQALSDRRFTKDQAPRPPSTGAKDDSFTMEERRSGLAAVVSDAERLPSVDWDAGRGVRASSSMSSCFAEAMMAVSSQVQSGRLLYVDHRAVRPICMLTLPSKS